MAESRSITQFLNAWSEGDRMALDQLAPYVSRELHILARAYLNRGGQQTLQPTELIN